MSSKKTRVSAAEGWLDTDTPHLLGSRCTSCSTYFFPREAKYCRSPHCQGTEFEEIRLSNRGTLWSFTNNCYKPPAPYISPDPYVPYIVAAVELADEKMVVLGQVVPGVEIADLKAGMEMELTTDTLFEDDDNEYIVWKWAPAAN